MKNTVYTVITVVLLLATLCLPAAAQTWTLDNWYAGPDDDRNNGNDIVDIEFRGNSQVFFAKWDRLYKWDLNAGWLWWHDFGGDRVSQVEVPRGDSSVVIHSVDDRGKLYIRSTDDMSSVRASTTLRSADYFEMFNLDVDSGGYYIYAAYVYGRHGGLGVGGPTAGNYWWTTDIFEIYDSGWQFDELEGGVGQRPVDREESWRLGMMHPNARAISLPSYPRWYYIGATSHNGRTVYERLRERDGIDNTGDTYVSPYYSDFDQIAITSRYGSDDNLTRIAALDNNNDIHLWNYSGDLLHTFNEWEDYSAHNDILEFTHNGELLVTAYGRWVRFWDVGAEAEDHSFWVEAMDDDESIESLAFSDNGKLMALGSSDGTAYIYEWTAEAHQLHPQRK